MKNSELPNIANGFGECSLAHLGIHVNNRAALNVKSVQVTRGTWSYCTVGTPSL